MGHLRNKKIEKIIRDEISMRFAVFAKQPEKKKQKMKEMYKVLEYIKELEEQLDRMYAYLKRLRDRPRHDHSLF